MAARAAHATATFWRRRAAGCRLVCATVHADLVPTLRPDWVFDTHAQLLTKYSWAEDGAAAELAGARASAGDPPAAPRPLLQVSTDGALFAPPSIEVTVRLTHPVGDQTGGKEHKNALWDELFKQHHYMSGELSPQATCAVARWGAQPVGFVAVLPQPGEHEALPALL